MKEVSDEELQGRYAKAGYHGLVAVLKLLAFETRESELIVGLVNFPPGICTGHLFFKERGKMHVRFTRQWFVEIMPDIEDCPSTLNLLNDIANEVATTVAQVSSIGRA